MLTRIVLVLLVGSALGAADWTKLNDLFKFLINERVFPGAQLAIANETAVIYRKNFGSLSSTYQVHEVEVNDTTKYDIASLTKVMATTLNVMNLVSSNTLKLDDLVSKWVPNYDTNKKTNTTIANLLLHNAGLPYDYPGALPRTTDEVIEYITFAKPDFPVGTKFQYSNLGFLLLGEIVAKASKKTFNNYFEQNKAFAGIKNTGFNPPKSEWYYIAPTEYDAGNPPTMQRCERG